MTRRLALLGLALLAAGLLWHGPPSVDALQFSGGGGGGASLSGGTDEQMAYWTGATTIGAAPLLIYDDDTTPDSFGWNDTTPDFRWDIVDDGTGTQQSASISSPALTINASMVFDLTLSGVVESAASNSVGLWVPFTVTGAIDGAGEPSAYNGVIITTIVPATNAEVFTVDRLRGLLVNSRFLGTGNGSVMEGVFASTVVNTAAANLIVQNFISGSVTNSGGATFTGFYGYLTNLGDLATNNYGFYVDADFAVMDGVGQTYAFYVADISAATNSRGLFVTAADQGVRAQSNTTASQLTSNFASTNTVGNIVQFQMLSSGGAGAAGLGGRLEFALETATDGTNDIVGQLDMVWTTATDNNGTADFVINLDSAGTVAERWRFTGAGNLLAAGDVADAGKIRLLNADIIGWEASPAGTDVTLTVSSAEVMTSSATFSAPTYATATNCSDSAGAAACSAAAAGSIVIDATATTVVVSTTAVTANSQIFAIFDSSLGTRLSVTCNTTVADPWISARTAATSFTITVASAPVTNPACYSYFIVN